MKLVALSLAAVMMACTVQAQSLNDLTKTASAGLDSANQAMSGSLTGALQDQLGISKDQAEGGIGSMLSLASEKLNAGEFDKFAGMIPGADKYLQSAKDLGAVTDPLKNMEGLTSALSSLGISPDTVSKFAPMVTEYLGKLGGDDMKSILGKVMGT